MPLRIALFLAFLAGASAYALRRGGAPERWTAATMLIAAISTAMLPDFPGRFTAIDRGEFAIDMGVLAILTVLASRADRFWPLWVAALQLVAIMVHAVRAYDTSILPIVYARGVGEIAYPMITLLVIGTWRHREREAERGPERDWSPLVWR